MTEKLYDTAPDVAKWTTTATSIPSAVLAPDSSALAATDGGGRFSQKMYG
ncbi:threonyl/alanyl tRNA synthetase SAD [Geobacillus sp. LEMMY01]|nr:threonyl/alanyl tRNA synthetase SAD [Geobacillus sp. LEMMY01]